MPLVKRNTHSRRNVRNVTTYHEVSRIVRVEIYVILCGIPDQPRASNTHICLSMYVSMCVSMCVTYACAACRRTKERRCSVRMVKSETGRVLKSV